MEDLVVPASARGQRLDRFVADTLALSRSRVQALIDGHHVLLNGSECKASVKLEGGETITVSIPPAEPTRLAAEEIAFHIVYQDDDVAVIDKPAGLTVHPSATQKSGTLVNALVGKLQALSGIGGELRPGIVHRLDKDTSGLLIVAKNDRAHQFLTAAFAARRVRKIYIAYVWGHPPDNGEWTQPIGRHPVDRKRFSTRAKRAKAAHTRFRTLGAYPLASKLEIELLTGRTHQIRVHAADNGFPLVGDKTYGRTPKNAPKFARQALHAFELALQLPSGIEKRFIAPLPDDLRQLESVLQAQRASGH